MQLRPPRRSTQAPIHAVAARSFGDAAGFGDVEPGLADWLARARPMALERSQRAPRGFGDSDGFGDAGGFDYGVASLRVLR